MRIIGVIDILDGRAVHARAGNRSAYAPVESAAGMRIDGDVAGLARVYVETLGVRELYVADLDAIGRGVSAIDAAAIASVAARGTPLWVDAGVSTPADAIRVIEAGASTVVVGLETLSSFDALAEVCDAIGGARVAFSLDLRNGIPIALPNEALATSTVGALAERAASSGVASIIVLDLARVGMGAGVDVQLMSQVRSAVSDVAVFAGGGVRDSADIDALASVGVDGALVATALLSRSINV